ncbi:LysR family transcriptional regulator [Aliiroseovarius sp. F20344]|uniref:LysR family transcriptional regulator n=1 Tax=Aliiroseovarius sp. F20344 TaxID=2926414 RepID=UPI001FF1F0F3|nr:LysR family transcriptional regulator [Aliiroseovarius sp. F20344]MCK0143614.1 LysR family transcriptional regulator [Aliiroseovarius sp. F20344]
MTRRLPSMNALRSFEAAARHQSFALAAVELNVSPAAVGFQVKRIEEDLGFPLFIRKHKAIELTREGTNLMRQLTKGFDIIGSAWQQAEMLNQSNTLKVTAPVALVKRWLFDEISQKARSRYKMQISWDMSQMNRRLGGSGPDAAIRYAIAPDRDLFSEPILRPWFTPLMRPDIARKVKSAADLEKHGLINVDFSQDGVSGLTAWAPWNAVQGLKPPTQYEMVCADTITAIDMAVETGYIAIGGYFAALEHVASGRLVAPFNTAVCPKSQFWFVCEKGRELEPEILSFRNAVKDCATRLKASFDDLVMFNFRGAQLSN